MTENHQEQRRMPKANYSSTKSLQYIINKSNTHSLFDNFIADTIDMHAGTPF